MLYAVLCLLIIAAGCAAPLERTESVLRYALERVHREPIVRGADVAAAGVGASPGRPAYRGHAMFPSVIAVPDWVAPEDRPRPNANYYLYFAPHHGTTINLAWAERIDAARWTLFNTVTDKAAGFPGRGVFDLALGGPQARLELAPGVVLRNHVSSPEVYVDEADKQFILIMHGRAEDGQDSFIAASRSGLNFNAEQFGGEPGGGPRPAVFSATTYLRIFDFKGGLYAIGRSGRFTRPRDMAAPWSAPAGLGRTPMWESSETCPISREALHLGIAERDFFRHGSLLVRDGTTLDLFYSRGLDGDDEHLLQATLDASADDWETWSVAAEPQSLLRPELDWERPEIHDSFVYASGGQLYLFYTAGPSGEDSIGLARLRASPQSAAKAP